MRGTMKPVRYTALAFLLALIQPDTTLAQWMRVIDSARVVSLAVGNEDIFAGVDDEPIRVSGFRVFRSTDHGSTWTDVGNVLGGTRVYALAVCDQNLIAATYGGYGGSGIWVSSDNGGSWILTAPLSHVSSLVVTGEYVFAASAGGVLRSSDNGMNWTALNNGLPNTFITSLCVSGTSLFAGTDYVGVFASQDNGENWTSANSGLTNGAINTLIANGDYVFAGTWGGGVFRTTNNGEHWSPANDGLTHLGVFSLTAGGTNLFAGTGPTNGDVFLSTNNGDNWISVNDGLTDPWVYTLGVREPYLFAGTRSGLWQRPMAEILSVGNSVLARSTTFALSQNYPNPFNPVTTVEYSVLVRSHVVLNIFDMLGREVATLANEIHEPGNKSVRWEAVDLASGLYICRLRSGSFVQERKMLLLR